MPHSTTNTAATSNGNSANKNPNQNNNNNVRDDDDINDICNFVTQFHKITDEIMIKLQSPSKSPSSPPATSLDIYKLCHIVAKVNQIISASTPASTIVMNVQQNLTILMETIFESLSISYRKIIMKELYNAFQSNISIAIGTQNDRTRTIQDAFQSIVQLHDITDAVSIQAMDMPSIVNELIISNDNDNTTSSLPMLIDCYYHYKQQEQKNDNDKMGCVTTTIRIPTLILRFLEHILCFHVMIALSNSSSMPLSLLQEQHQLKLDVDLLIQSIQSLQLTITDYDKYSNYNDPSNLWEDFVDYMNSKSATANGSRNDSTWQDCIVSWYCRQEPSDNDNVDINQINYLKTLLNITTNVHDNEVSNFMSTRTTKKKNPKLVNRIASNSTDTMISEIQRRVHMIQQVLQPNIQYGDGFLETALALCSGNVNETITLLLQPKDLLPPSLQMMDTKLSSRYEYIVQQHNESNDALQIVKQSILQIEKQQQQEALLLSRAMSSTNDNIDNKVNQETEKPLSRQERRKNKKLNINNKNEVAISKSPSLDETTSDDDNNIDNDNYNTSGIYNNNDKNNNYVYDDDYDDQYDDQYYDGGAGGLIGNNDNTLYDKYDSSTKNKNDADINYKAIKLYNQTMKEIESDVSFWESNKNTNRTSKQPINNNKNNDDDNNKSDKQYKGPDKLRGGRIPRPQQQQQQQPRSNQNADSNDDSDRHRGEIEGRGGRGGGGRVAGRGGRGRGRGGRGGDLETPVGATTVATSTAAGAAATMPKNSRQKERNLAKRREQQKKAMYKQSG